MNATKCQIEVGGKFYGYWLSSAGDVVAIRSESNPHKTPYLKEGSPQYNRVLGAIWKSVN